MAQTPDEIRSHIESKQEDLRSNLEELEGRVKSIADWRQHFRRNPGVGLGFAFAGGLLLASMRGGADSRAAGTYRPSHAISREGGTRNRLILQAWENIRSALIGVAASKVAYTLAQMVPGFRDHLARRTGAGDAREAKHSGNGMQGEGEYRAARRYRSAAERFAHTADVERAVRGATPGNEAEFDEMAGADAEPEAGGRARAKPS
jgi:hypothetical protein